MATSCFLRFVFFSILCAAVNSQSVPPLQWLNITNLLQGSSAPIPLRDAVIGYDPTTSTVIVFGGESAGGTPQSTTYLLDTQSLIWSMPNPPTGLTVTPSARSGSVSASDFAASNRGGFLVIGGKDMNGNPLSDVWEFDYSHQFWTQVNITPSFGPSARWGAAGGKDQRISAIADPVLPGPNNSFYYAGGFDGTSLEPLSDVWRLNISGVLSPNSPTPSVVGSWESISINNIDSLSAQSLASTMVQDTVAIYGGCNVTTAANDSCATQNAYALDTDTQSSSSPAGCPAPRLGAVMSPNLNSVSDSNTQVMLLLGTFNTSLWSDNNTLENGEVAFWDTSANEWTARVIPAPDGAGSSSPSPREGSAIVSSPSAMFGSGSYSDTLIFGGRDTSGNYLSELWVLRAYNGVASPSNPKWSGFGDGTLGTGVNASGTGVDVQFITTCASAISPGSSGSPISTPKPSGSSKPSNSSSGLTDKFDTSTTHKIFGPLSLALVFGGVMLGRAFSPFFSDNTFTVRSMAISISVLLICLALGVAGLVTAFTSISFNAPVNTLSRRSSSSSLHLHTAHGQAAFAFFVALYGVLPLLWVFSRCASHSTKPNIEKESPEINPPDRQQTASIDISEKLRPVQTSSRPPSRPSSPRPRTHSWSPSVFWRPSTDRQLSSDTDSISSAEQRTAPPTSAEAVATRSFEVVNRPQRHRRLHTASLDPASALLRDVDWLQRRRSLDAVGELDYAITQAQRRREREILSVPPTTEVSTTPLLHTMPRMPSAMGILLHVLLQLFILGLTVICLIILWSQSLIGFIVFLVLALAFYVALVALAWKGRPTISILAVLLNRLRAEPDSQSTQGLNQYVASQTPPVSAPDHYHFPSQGPYFHEPLFQVAASTDLSHGGPRSVTTEDYDDDEDEDARQQRIEGEMGRREVVTVTTVPRRQLWVANPS